ncbi:hypothetical protein HMSSN036_33550 [Paenibacillus macerans]|nr:hypothetical protein HMSSN036_33550 [Paenibacillus macerans]
MKLMFISDIHGSAHWLDRALEKAEEERPDQLVMLGDFLYHGPRNPLPDGYDPKRAAETLNRHKHKIAAVRGNCDAEVDQMLLEFPMMADYAMICMRAAAFMRRTVTALISSNCRRWPKTTCSFKAIPISLSPTAKAGCLC